MNQNFFRTNEIPGKISGRERSLINDVIFRLENMFGGYSTNSELNISTPMGVLQRIFEVKRAEFQITFILNGYSCGYKHLQTDQIETGITVTEIVHREAFETFNQLLPKL